MKLFSTFIVFAFIWIGSILASNIDEDQLVLTRQPRERGKYLGCFQDNINQRMFLGYFGKDANMTIEKCLNLCTHHRYVYAGLHGT